MSTAEGSKDSSSNNAENMSEDLENGNTIKMSENEVTNRELDQIMENITSGSRDQIPSLIGDDNENAQSVPFIDKTKELSEVNSIETPSPNNGSDSQDEDLLLRWDDDDDIADDQAKLDNVILKEFEAFDDKIAGDSTTESELVSNDTKSNDGKYIIIPEIDVINTVNDSASNEANPGKVDVIIEKQSINQENDIFSTNYAPTNVIMEDVAENNAISTTDGKKNDDDTSKLGDVTNDLIDSGEGNANVSSSEGDVNFQISDDNEIAQSSTSKIINIANCDVSSDIEMSSIPADVHIRQAASIPSVNNATVSSIIDENKIIQDINEKISKALETDDLIDDDCLKSCVPFQEIEQDNTVFVSEGIEMNVADDENEIIQNMDDKIGTEVSEVGLSQENDDQNTEQEEKSCDKNIKLREQQLKVLSKSINSNLEIHTDIVPDNNTDIEEARKTISEAASALEEAVSCTTVESTRLEMDDNDQINKNQSCNGSDIGQSIDYSKYKRILEKSSSLEVEVDVSIDKDQIDKTQNEPGLVQNIDSRIDKDQQMGIDVNIKKKENPNEDQGGQNIDVSIEKDIGLKIDGGIKILNVDQINKNLNRNEPEIVQNIDSYDEKHAQLEGDTDVSVEYDQTTENLNKPEIVHVDSRTIKGNNIAKDTKIDLELDHSKQKEVEEENAVTESDKPEKIINESEKESDEDDDVVEIIERCDSYIDLSSQSPINLDNEVDSEIPNESFAPKTSTKVVTTNNSDKIESKFHAVKSDNVKIDHRLRPDVMLEIPMHNLIDVDGIDESINIDSEETSQDSVTKVSEVKNTEEQVKTVAIEEENISAVEKELDDVNLTHQKSEKALKELRNEIADLNMKIKNEPNCELVKEITEMKTEKVLDIKEENFNQKSTNIEKIIDLDDYEAPSGSKRTEVKLEEDTKPNISIKVMDELMQSSSDFGMRMTPDTADEAPEVSDSLGLLAESSRVRREDEDMEEDEDDDDDYDQDDESSNQMTADHSEDSNAQHSEPDSKDQEDKTGEKERPFNFEPSDNVDREEDEVVVEETVVSAAVSLPADGVGKDADVESIAVDKNDEQAKKEGEVTPSPMDTDTVKLSDNSDNDIETIITDQDPTKPSTSKDDKATEISLEKTSQSPSKTKKLGIATPRLILNIVDLEESSSSEGDLQEIPLPDQESEPVKSIDADVDVDVDVDADVDVTTVNIPTDIEIMSTSCGNISEIVTKEGEVVIQGVPKPPPHKPARLNTSEVTIKTAPAATESTLIIPEAKMSESSQNKPKVGLEIFNLDSDDDDIGGNGKGTGGRQKLTALELDAALRSGRCLRRGCTGHAGPLGHYCEQCANAHYLRTQRLVEGIKNMTPLLDLNMEKLSQDLVEISDSDSDNEAQEPKETIGEAGATLLEENLAQMINSMWSKYKMDANLLDAKGLLDAEMERLDNESKEINKMLNDCQSATDKLRNELYATFEPKRQELPAISIYNTPEGVIINCEPDTQTELSDVRHCKRLLSALNLPPAKRPAIPLGYASLDANAVLTQIQQDQTMLMAGEYSNRYDDDKDVSVVKLSAESAPPDLPPPGEPKRPALRVGMQVYAMRNAFGSWSRARIIESTKVTGQAATQFPSFRVRFDHKVKNPCKVLSARCLAYLEPADVRLTIGTRVIALFKEASNQAKTESYYSGIIAEIPNPVNNYRYLVFFDDGYAQYASHAHTRVVCASAAPVWEEVHPFSRDFVRNYLCAYPERPMVRLHAGQRLNTEWNGKWWDSRVIQVDASLVQVHFEEDNRTEWIYRGSTRLEPLFLELQAAVRHRGRHLPRSKAQLRTNMPYVEYTRSYEQDRSFDAQQEELRRQRSVAKKSTANTLPVTGTAEGPDAFASRVVYYTPRNAVRPYKMVAHTCGPKCKRSDVLTLKELRSYNPLAKPLLSGWERQLVRNKGGQAVLYRAPCGRRLRSARELHRYLRLTRSDAPVDLFDFNPDTHCLAEFVLSKCIVGKKDLSHGKENVPVPCVNSVDSSLPEFCSYNTERTPTAGVPLNLDPEFLCGCDCTDDCEDKLKCACWQMTLEGAKTIGIEGTNVGYVYKRLPEPLPSGIYECNVRCKCKATCLNRVAQHPLQLKLQVFKTPNRGWGIRALNDVPKGAFLCVYAGNLLTDATANLDGLNEGDEYLAELDYIEVVEQMKEGYEEDVPEADKILDKKETEKKEDKTSTEEESSSEEDEKVSKDEEMDDDFRPGYIGLGVMEFNKRLRKRGKKRGQEEQVNDGAKKDEKDEQKEQNAEEDCITISDDEEVREPSRFTAQAGMGAIEYVSKYRSVRAHFGRDEACYIMDAKVQGNIGRYLNHSCSPNVFVQNVFVDTHDPRFPWVAFFALSHIRAGTELTWNYNYDVGSVPGKVLYCYCGAPNCRRRLL